MTQTDSKQTTGIKNLDWNGKNIELTRLLGAGLTADVYQAVVNEKDAAIKVLKPGSSAEVKNFFLSEMNNITEVRNAWASRYPGVPQVVPEIIGGEKEGETPFIIMDLVKGKPIDEEIKAQGPFSESVALHLFSQFGMLLVVLHEKIKKYYADIKIDNLWKLSKTDPSGQPLLTVTDWNVLNEYTEEGRIRDLFFTSLYLFQILTGASLPYKHGQVKAKLDSFSEFTNLTYGTQEFLRKSLNINVNRRFASAQEWLNALNELKVNWEKEATDLNKLAAKYLDIAQEKQASRNIAEAADAYQKARMLLDISAFKGFGVKVVYTELYQKVNKGFESTSHKDKGLISLRGGLYKEASEIFDEGADFSVLDPELLRRFYWLSRGADEIGRQYFGAVVEDAITAVDKLVKGETVQAQSILEEIAEKLLPSRSESLTHLINEAKILNLADEAIRLRDAADFTGVVNTYQTAYTTFRTLPATPPTNWAEKLGDIKFLLQEAVNDEKTLGIARECCQKAVDAYSRNEIEQSAEEFSKAFSAATEDEYSLNQLKKCVSTSLSEGKWMDASTLIERVIGLGDLKEKIKNYWEITTRLRRISSAFKRMKYDDGLAEITSYQTSFSGDELAMGLSLKSVLQVALETSQANEEVEAATKIIQIASQVNPDWGNEFKETHKSFKSELSERIEDVVPQLLLNIYDLHDKNDLDCSNKAAELIIRLKAILPDTDSRKADVLKIEQMVENRRNLLLESKKSSAGTVEDTIQMLKKTISEADETINEKINKIATLSLSNRDERAARALLLEEVSQQALEGLKSAATWQRLQPGISEPAEKLKRFASVLNKTGSQGWPKISELAMAATSQLEQYKKSFTNAYQSGNIEGAQQILDETQVLIGNEDDVHADRETLASTQEMLTWAAGLNAPEDGNVIPVKYAQVETRAEREAVIAEKFLDLPIHALYWAKVKPQEYFDHQCMEFLRAFSRQAQNHNIDFELLEKALLCNQISRKIRKQSALNKDASLDGTENSLLSAMPAIEELYSCKDTKKEVKYLIGVRKAFDQVTVKKQFSVNDFNSTAQTYRLQVEKKRKSSKTFRLIAFIVGGLIILGVGIWALLHFIIGPANNPEVTPTVEVTAVPIPTATTTPTATIEPTPVVSKFLTGSEIPGFDKTAYGEIFVIDDTDALLEGGVEGAWKSSTESGINQSFQYIDTLTPEETLTITWKMDLGLTNSGLYRIALNETKVHSMLKSGITMQVLADDVEVKPLVGSGLLEFGNDAAQEVDAWRTIGEYQFEADQVITVKMTVTGINLSAGVNELGIDALLIAEKKTPLAEDFSLLSNLPQSNLLLAMADYTKVEVSDSADPWEAVPPQDGITGDGFQINLLTVTKEPSIIIPFSQSVLGPGKYHVWALISDKLSTDATYTVLVDDEKVGEYKVLSTAGIAGTFVELLSFDLEEGDHQISIKVAPTKFTANQDVILGTNAIFLSIDTAITIN